MLGIVNAKDGDKCMKFDKQFITLGLQVDVKESSAHKAFMGHTESRVTEFFSLLDDIIHSGRIDGSKLTPLGVWAMRLSRS